MFRHFLFEGSPYNHRCGGPRGRADEHRNRHAGFGGPRDRWERGFGGGRERMFDQGDLRLVLLALLHDEPSYGYQLIKRIEEKLAGGYTPSPGVVYPTLTMLEEEGLATVASSENGKKVYTLTDAGREQLKASQSRVDEIFARVRQAHAGFARGRSPHLMRAFMNLRSAVRARVTREGLTPEQVQKIAEAIEAAARAIDAI